MFGAWEAPVQLRFTTKYDAVGPLLDLPHARRTRIRFSVNARRRSASRAARRAWRSALGHAAGCAGGLPHRADGRAPSSPCRLQAEYARLLADCGAALEGAPDRT
jgi:spore photoproduct lyase